MKIPRIKPNLEIDEVDLDPTDPPDGYKTQTLLWNKSGLTLITYFLAPVGVELPEQFLDEVAPWIFSYHVKRFISPVSAPIT